MGEPLVRGEIVFDSPPETLTGATIWIRLEDTSMADMFSEVVVERALADLPAKLAADERIPFSLCGPTPDPRTSYSLSVHVDLRSSGQLDHGDYVNVASYPVLTFGYPSFVTVRVQRVGGAA